MLKFVVPILPDSSTTKMMSAGHSIGGGDAAVVSACVSAVVSACVGGDDVGPTTPFDVSYS